MIPQEMFQERLREIYINLEGRIRDEGQFTAYANEQYALYTDGVRDGRIGDTTFQAVSDVLNDLK
jgi:hypothetical protein